MAIFSNITPLLCVTSIGDEKIDRDGRFIMLEFNNLFLINVYQPCSGEQLKFMSDRMHWDNKV